MQALLDFHESRAFKVFQEIVGSQIAGYSRVLDNSDEINEIRKAQGGKKALKELVNYILDIVEYAVGIKKFDDEEETE